MRLGLRLAGLALKDLNEPVHLFVGSSILETESRVLTEPDLKHDSCAFHDVISNTAGFSQARSSISAKCRDTRYTINER